MGSDSEQLIKKLKKLKIEEKNWKLKIKKN